MWKIPKFKTWLLESKDLDRLNQLGMAPEFPFSDWVIRLIEQDPDFRLGTRWSTDTVSLKWGPAESIARLSITHNLNPDGTNVSWLKITITKFFKNGKPDTDHYAVRLEPGTTPLDSARTGLKVAKRLLTGAEDNTSESLDRLVQLGIAPDNSVLDWLIELLKGHPDFQTQRSTTNTILVGRPWARTDIIIRVGTRALNADGDTEITDIKLGYLDAQGIQSSRYAWTPDEIRIGPGNLGIARGLLEILEDYYSRAAVGIGTSESLDCAPDPGPLAEGGEAGLLEATDFTNYKRLIALGVVPNPKTSWDIVRNFLEQRLGDRVHEVEKGYLVISFPENGLEFRVHRWHVGRYGLQVVKLTQDEETVLSDVDWELPHDVPRVKGAVDPFETADRVLRKVDQWITLNTELHGTGRVSESQGNYDRLLDLGMINTDRETIWNLTVKRLRHRFPELDFRGGTFTRSLYLIGDGLDLSFSLIGVNGVPSCTIKAELEKKGQWQPLKRAVHHFKFSVTGETRWKGAASSMISNIDASAEISDFISEIIRDWWSK